MSNVKIYIKHKITDPQTGDTRTETKATIVTRASIPQFQRVFGQRVGKIVPVDEHGNEMPGQAAKGTAPIGTAKERALGALRKKGQELGIKGWATMGEEKLLKKVQEVHAKKK